MSKRPATRATPHSDTAVPKRSRDAVCTIDDLPDEMLARVFRELSCWALFKVERVSRRWMGVVKRHGWPNVDKLAIHDFNKHDKRLRKYERLLERCGHYVQWLTLKHNCPHRLALLKRCPNIRHLQLSRAISPQFLVGTIHMDRLKSLSLRPEMGYGSNFAVQVAALNDLFDAAANSLELLLFIGDGFRMIEILFPSGLRCLQLTGGSKYVGGFTLSAVGVAASKTIQSVAEPTCQFLTQLSNGRRFTHLRSLDMDMLNAYEQTPLPPLSSLRHLPQLAHLTLNNGYRAGTAAIEKLCHAFSHLPNLKSLEVSRCSSRMLEVITRECPQLEHLGWNSLDSNEARSQGVKALQAVKESLTWLRSLEISGFQWPKNPSWEWLEALLERGRLEYINLNTTLPARLFYATIEKCPRLHAISVHGKYSVEKIVKAADDAQAPSGGEPLPIIYCHVLMQNPGEERRGRVVFRDWLQWEAPKSHVLLHYRYGCLSEGVPRWDEEDWD